MADSYAVEVFLSYRGRHRLDIVLSHGAVMALGLYIGAQVSVIPVEGGGLLVKVDPFGDRRVHTHSSARFAVSVYSHRECIASGIEKHGAYKLLTNRTPTGAEFKLKSTKPIRTYEM